MENICNSTELDCYTTKTWFKSALAGLLIGLAIIIPGVSGATIALLFALYNKIIFAFANVFKSFKKCFSFLLPLAIGVILGFVLGFFAVKEFFMLAPFILICLFAGMMLGGMQVFVDNTKAAKWSKVEIVMFITILAISVAVAIISALLNKTDIENADNSISVISFILYVLLGVGVATTQLVPGLSATVLLMLFGQFGYILNNISISAITANPSFLLVLLALVIGAILGVVLLSKIINNLLNSYPQKTNIAIFALAIGSIFSMFVNGELFNVYGGWANGNSSVYWQIPVGIILFAIGFVCIRLILKMQNKLNENK